MQDPRRRECDTWSIDGIPVKKAKSDDNICKIGVSLAHKLKELFFPL
jgi:hypothetical protein